MSLMHIAQNADVLIHLAQVIPANVHHALQPVQHLATKPTCPTNQTNINGKCTATTGVGDPYQDLLNFANNILGLVQILAMIVFGISITIAGMMRMLSFGSQQRTMFSNMAMTSAFVGLLVVTLATPLRIAILRAFR